MARPRWVDLALVVAIVPLGIWAWRTGRECAGLEAKYARYTRKAGELEVGDRSKALLRKLETDEPFHFAWRIFLPAWEYRQVGSMGVKSSFIAPGDEPMIYRFRIGEDSGRLRFGSKISHEGGGNGMESTFGEEAVAKLLHGRWDRIIVEQTAATELVGADPSKPLVLLRLKLPADLEAEAREKLHGLPEIHFPTFFELTLEPEGQNP